MKKVISYSLWGNNETYTVGMIHNAKLIPIVYPEWTCRVYYDDSVPTNIITELDFLGVELIKKESDTEFLPSLWRFEAMFDESVDLFVCRDADSRVDVREKLAVDEWMASGKGFHIMRDHPSGHKVEIMAGMWGGVRQLCDVFYDDYTEFITNTESTSKGCDQYFLKTVLWPVVKGNCLSHDEYFNFNGQEKPFPMKCCGVYHVGRRCTHNESGFNFY